MKRKPPPQHQPQKPAPALEIDARDGLVVVIASQGDRKIPFSFSHADARQIAAVIAARADVAYTQALEQQLASAQSELTKLRQPAKE